MSKLRERLFQSYDGHYLRGNQWTGGDLSTQVYEQVIPEYEASYGEVVAGLPGGSAIVDVGCGVGFLLYWLHSRRQDSFKLNGVDCSASQLALARKALPDSIELLNADASDFLRTRKENFAAVFCTDVLEHIEGDDAMLELLEAARAALIPGGNFVCHVPNMANLVGSHSRYVDMTHVRGFTSRSLIQLLEAAGFKDCRILEKRAVDTSQLVRMRVEEILHYIIYRICGEGSERHFAKNLIGVGKA